MIELQKVSLVLGGKAVLHEVSLQVQRGRRLALLGPSGSGKSSLLRVAAGLERPDGGKVMLDGRLVSAPGFAAPPRSRRMSMVFQSLALWPHMTAAQHLAFVSGGSGRHIADLLGSMRLSGKEGRYPAQLSGGERQRLAIARALASEPEYLLLDEPFSSLDQLLKEELLDLVMEQIAVRNMGAIFVTHNLDEALKAANSLAVMTGGQVRKTWDEQTIRQITREEILACFGEAGDEK